MIVYYTGTGNSKYVADKISAVTGDDVRNVTDFTKGNAPFELFDDESLIFVCPVYFWGIPASVKEFVGNLKTEGRYFALVLQCGGSTGNAQGIFEKYARPDAVFGLVAVDNYCPMFRVPSGEAVIKGLDALDEKIEEAALKIKNREVGDFNVVKGALPKLNTVFMYPLYEPGRKTTFKVNDKCISCGLCANICPVSAIKIENGRPVWIKSKCDMCLGCLSRCPQNAISVKKSDKNGRYVNPRVKF